MNIINSINDILWTYILIALLLGCAFWFTLKTRFVQFRMIGEMVRLLGDSAGTNGKPGEKHISSFQAFAISIACSAIDYHFLPTSQATTVRALYKLLVLPADYHFAAIHADAPVWRVYSHP